MSYAKGTLGKDECPSGYSKITDRTQCKAAAAAVGYTYYDKTSDLSSSNSLCNYCGGCGSSDGGKTARIDSSHGSAAVWICGAPTSEVKTDAPTATPTAAPTNKPTANPTSSPTEKPSHTPTNSPTLKPTAVPTKVPTDKPTTRDPTTDKPSFAPTATPTEKPTVAPTPVPSIKPTKKPTHTPTEQPTQRPTRVPTDSPTGKGTVNVPMQQQRFVSTTKATTFKDGIVTVPAGSSEFQFVKTKTVYKRPLTMQVDIRAY
jgi:hypothetical protein